MSNRLSIIVAAALAASGCVTDQPLLVTGIFSLDADHKGACIPSAVALGSGSLDLAGFGDYLISMDVVNSLDDTIETRGGEQTLIGGIHRNTVILDTITYTYTSVPAVNFAQEANPLALVLLPSGTALAKNQIRLPLFNRKALQKLYAELPGALTPAGTLDIRDVKIKVVFSGSVVSGGRISSVPITFPVTVFNSGFKCAAGDTFGPLGPCASAGGQDGARLCCSSDVTCVISK